MRRWFASLEWWRRALGVFFIVCLASLISKGCEAKAQGMSFKIDLEAECVDDWKVGKISYRECLDRRLYLRSCIIDSVVWGFSKSGSTTATVVIPDSLFDELQRDSWSEVGALSWERKPLKHEKGPLWLGLF